MAMRRRADTQNRVQGLFSGEVVLNLLVASLTLLFEGIWVVGRYRSDGWKTAYVVELVAASILWVIWLCESHDAGDVQAKLMPAAASAYSAASEHMRSICTDYEALLVAAKMAGTDDVSIGEL